MDIDDPEEMLEDMLFGFSSQDTQAQLDYCSESEDDMLVDGSDSDMDLWDAQEDALLTTPPTDCGQDDDMLDFADETPLELTDFNTDEHSSSLVRDR